MHYLTPFVDGCLAQEADRLTREAVDRAIDGLVASRELSHKGDNIWVDGRRDQDRRIVDPKGFPR